MKRIYKEYFQKSYTFLYPLLDLTNAILPQQTYIEWEGFIDTSNYNLICVYEIEDTAKWIDFEINQLMNHSLLNSSVLLKNNKIAYIFNFNIPELINDFNFFINGKYSKFTKNTKGLLKKYYTIKSPEWKYIESYIYPEKYFKSYSEILDADEDRLKEVGELTDKYDPVKETCTELLIN